MMKAGATKYTKRPSPKAKISEIIKPEAEEKNSGNSLQPIFKIVKEPKDAEDPDFLVAEVELPSK